MRMSGLTRTLELKVRTYNPMLKEKASHARLIRTELCRRGSPCTGNGTETGPSAESCQYSGTDLIPSAAFAIQQQRVRAARLREAAKAGLECKQEMMSTRASTRK